MKLIGCPDCSRRFASIADQRKHAALTGCRKLKIVRTPKGYSLVVGIEYPAEDPSKLELSIFAEHPTLGTLGLRTL